MGNILRKLFVTETTVDEQISGGTVITLNILETVVNVCLAAMTAFM